VPFSLNNSCGLKRRTMICGTYGGKQNRYLQKIGRVFNNFCREIFVVYLAIVIMYLAKPFFSSLKNCVVYIAIYVAYLAKPLLLDYLTMFETNRLKSKFLYCTGRLLNCSSSKIFTRVAQYYLSCIYLDPARTSSLESVILIVNSTSNK